MDAHLRWVTSVVSDLLLWVVGVRGADVLEGGGQTHPQVMEFGLVLLRFLMICGGFFVFSLLFYYFCCWILVVVMMAGHCYCPGNCFVDVSVCSD
jgi:hypothetical protein